MPRDVKFDPERIAEAVRMVLKNGGRVDFDSTKVYEVKNVLRIDLRIKEVPDNAD